MGQIFLFKQHEIYIFVQKQVLKVCHYAYNTKQKKREKQLY